MLKNKLYVKKNKKEKKKNEYKGKNLKRTQI